MHSPYASLGKSGFFRKLGHADVHKLCTLLMHSAAGFEIQNFGYAEVHRLCTLLMQVSATFGIF